MTRLKELLEKGFLQKRRAEAAAVQRAEAMFLDGFSMSFRAISFMIGEPIAGVIMPVAAHERITSHFGDDRGGSDGRALRVTLHDVDFARIEVQRIAVKQKDVRNDTVSLDCLNRLRKRKRKAAHYAMGVDLLGIDEYDLTRQCRRLDFAGNDFPLLGTYLLGIIQAFYVRIVGQNDCAYGERPRNASTTDLIKPNEHLRVMLSRNTCLVAVQSVDSFALLFLGSNTTACNFQSALDPNPRIGRQGALHNG